MRRSIDFGSIFRRKDDQQPTHSSEQGDQGLLAKWLAERKIILRESDLKPLTEESLLLDWATVNGQLTLSAAAIDGLLQGRARIRAQHLKSLTPSPIGSDVPDATEYAVSHSAVVPQIEDLLESAEAETTGEPEFDTPFTALVEEDRARFESASNKKHKPKSRGQPAAALESGACNDVQLPQAIRSGKKDHEEPPQEESLIALRTDSRRSDDQVESRAQSDVPCSAGNKDLVRRGVEKLQEIFMVDEFLDGGTVASLLQQFPGVTGALILMDGGAILGGQLPDWLSLEAALRAPEVLVHFIRFIIELEAGRQAQSRFLSVTSATTISLVRSGPIVLLVSHQSRKLPPGLALRLTETAEALNLIYGK